MKEITSLTNSFIKECCALKTKKARDQRNRFLVEGEHLISEALKGNRVETILICDRDLFHFENTIKVTPQILHKISDNVSEVHEIAICKKSERPLTGWKRLLLLDGIQDPGNMGTLIRTAVSFGFDGILISEDCVDVYNPKTVRSTQGALFHIPIIRDNLTDKIQKLKLDGIRVIATSLTNAMDMEDIPAETHMAFILGNEGQGVRKECIALSDACMRIDMNGFESLNVAVAGGIIMYRYRQ